MIRRDFKFFDINEIRPYHEYATGDFEPYINNGGYIRNRLWHWTNRVVINRIEPDGFERYHQLMNFRNMTFNEFLRRFDHYEIYVYSITRMWELNGHRLHIEAPSTNNNYQLSDYIDLDNDVIMIRAILI